jgi:hypothetical protein
MPDEDVPPALFLHCESVYDAMSEQATETPDGILIYDGFLTKLFVQEDLSIPYYTQVMGLLKQMRCVQQMRRGGNNTTSQWALLQPPTLEAFGEAKAQLSGAGKLRSSRSDGLEQKVRDLGVLYHDLKREVEELRGLINA